jgi:hypothetical protein
LAFTSAITLRAEDGFGLYAPLAYDGSSAAIQAYSVAFAFETGEVWSVDTTFLNGHKMAFLQIARALVHGLHNYALFLRNLGYEPPFEWIAGIEGVKNWELMLETRLGLSRAACLSNSPMEKGTYDMNETPGIALLPFFTQLMNKCGVQYPPAMKAEIEKYKP